MLKNKNGYVRSIDVAHHLNFTKPSVSVAMKSFREEGYVTVDTDGNITLTDKGMEIAQKIYERHQFFTEQLVAAGVDRETAEQDACRIEHVISDTSFQKLKEKIQGTD